MLFQVRHDLAHVLDAVGFGLGDCLVDGGFLLVGGKLLGQEALDARDFFGFLLGEVGASALADAVLPVLASREVFPVALAPWEEMKGAPRDARWRVAVNVDLEPDL